MSRARLYVGDALAVLRTLPSESVQMCCTSPPYWGLRDYGQRLGTLLRGDWGDFPASRRRPNAIWMLRLRARAARRGGIESPNGHACIAVLGLESNPEMYVKNLVNVFREVRRVLRNDGTLWLNLGDSYAGGGNGARDPGRWPKQSRNASGFRSTHAKKHSGLKPKDLVMMPARVALALQADRWWLRSDIVWHKPTPMPESVNDRPTRAHEYVFLLSKSNRYFYDADAIKESVTGNAHSRGNGVNPKAKTPAGWDTKDGGHREKTGRYPRPKQNESFSAAAAGLVDMRNARSVWTIQAVPFPGAHFATFPPELASRCIKAGSKPCDTILDPFGGSGTTAATATGLGRDAIHIDLKPEYLDLACHRIGPLLCDVVPA